MNRLKIKAKNTYYRGNYFRARLEARWAVWLTWMEKKYVYEAEGFELNGMNYLPDFWLPEDNMWVEIKPDPPTLDEIEKAIRLEEKTGHAVLFFVGQPWPTECFWVHYHRDNRSYKETFVDTWASNSILNYNVIIAFRKARAARFEPSATTACKLW